MNTIAMRQHTTANLTNVKFTAKKQSFLRAVLFAFIIIFHASLLLAQKPYVPEWGIGVQGGANTSIVSLSPKVEQKMLPGYSAGLLFNYRGANFTGIQLEANYSVKGWQEKDSIGVYKRALTYYEIPVLAHFAFGKRAVKYHLDLGPWVSFLSQETESFDLTVDTTYRIHHGKPLDSNFDFGFLVSMGLQFDVGQGAIQVHGRITQGLQNVFLRPPSGVYRRSLNTSFHAGVAYIFFFRAKQAKVYKLPPES